MPSPNVEDQIATPEPLAPLGIARVSSVLGVLQTPLYTNAFYLWASAAIGALGGFAFWALVARLYSAEEVGLGAAAFALLTWLTMFSHFGLGLGLIRFLPESGDNGRRLVNTVFITSAISAASLAAVFLIGLPLWAPQLAFLTEQPLYAVAFLAFVVLGTLSVVQAHVFMAMRQAKYVFVQFVSLSAIRLILPALLVVFFGTFGIVASGGMALALVGAMGFILVTKCLPGYRPKIVVDRAALAELFPYSITNYIAEFLILSPGLILPIVVVALLGSTQGAYFYIAWLLGYLIASASAQLALSLLVEGSHNPQALRILSRNAMIGALTIASLAAVFLLLLADKVLLAFGSDYAAEGAALLRVMALAAIPAAIVNVYVGALRVMKRIRELVLIAGLVTITTMALSYALLPVTGLVGAGIGYGVGQGLGVAVIVGRLLAIGEGTIAQRVRALLASSAGRQHAEKGV